MYLQFLLQANQTREYFHVIDYTQSQNETSWVRPRVKASNLTQRPLGILLEQCSVAKGTKHANHGRS